MEKINTDYNTNFEKSRKVKHFGYDREVIWISDLNYQKFCDIILFPRILVSFRID